MEAMDGSGNFCDLGAKIGLPTVAQETQWRVHLRPRTISRATVDNLRLTSERRLVDQTGIEPVTS